MYNHAINLWSCEALSILPKPVDTPVMAITSCLPTDAMINQMEFIHVLADGCV